LTIGSATTAELKPLVYSEPVVAALDAGGMKGFDIRRNSVPRPTLWSSRRLGLLEYP